MGKQNIDSTRNVFKVWFSFEYGFAQYNFNSINNFLRADNLPNFKNDLFTPGISINIELPNVRSIFFNLEGYGNYSKIYKGGNGLQQYALNTDINANYLFLNKKYYDIYAGLGMGVANFEGQFSSHQRSQNFSQVFLNPNENVDIQSFRNYYLNINVGYILSIDDKGIFKVGVNAGYRVPLGDKNWSVPFSTYTDAPQTTSGGAFVKLSVIVCSTSQSK